MVTTRKMASEDFEKYVSLYRKPSDGLNYYWKESTSNVKRMTPEKKVSNSELAEFAVKIGKKGYEFTFPKFPRPLTQSQKDFVLKHAKEGRTNSD